MNCNKNILFKKKLEFVDTYLNCVLEVFNEYPFIESLNLKFSASVYPGVMLTKINNKDIKIKSKGTVVDEESKSHLIELNLKESDYMDIVQFLEYQDADLINQLKSYSRSNHCIILNREKTNELKLKNKEEMESMCVQVEVVA